MPQTSSHLAPTPQSIQTFMGRALDAPVTMLNLLRFRAQADYAASLELAPKESITGEQAYQRYMQHTGALLEKAGGKVVFVGRAQAALIGPSDEKWDLVLVVQYDSAQAFLDFTADPAYQAVAGHRQAALSDSRLFPMDAGL